MSDSQNNPISFSSIEAQRQLRIQKAKSLQAMGHNPFTPNSHRVFTLGMVRFWFDFVHKFDLEKLGEDLDGNSLNYFLYDMLFPESLVQILENKLYLKTLTQEFDLDIDEFESEFDRDLLNEGRVLLPDLTNYTDDQKIKLKQQLFYVSEEDDLELNDKVELALKPNQRITLAGRIKSKRVSGKIAFASIEDESCPDGFQFIFKKDALDQPRRWSLNFRTETQLESLKEILAGQKTIETRALNPEEPERYFGDIQAGDVIELCDLINNHKHYFNVKNILKFSNFSDAAASDLDFSKVSSKLPSKVQADDLRNRWMALGEDYVQKIETNGLVAVEIEPITPPLNFADFKNLIDEGDYIQATGTLDYSNSGEPSLFVDSFEILTKALRPLPEKLDYENFESRYLDRVADFKMNTKDDRGLSVRDIIRAKAKYWSIWREEMIREGFLEVECPIFEAVPGGADAKPFTTFYNLLDQEMYLRISLELPLKELIAGGFEKVFEIGRIFRNEGSDPTHLQEYTQIEWYWAYSNYYDAIPLIVRIYRRIAQELLGQLIQIDYYGNEINWGEWCTEAEARKNGWKLYSGWPAINYFDAVRFFSANFHSKGEVDLEGKNYEELLQIAAEQGIEIEPGTSFANLMDKIYKKVARPYMIQPMFLIQQPVELEPLAKRDPENPNLIHRWQVVAGGAELGKCFSELNDPIDQYDRFAEQQAARDAGDEEAQFMNEKYVKALEYGLPPLSGFGMSERLVSFLLGKHIRECVTFPAVRSEKDTPNKDIQSVQIVLLDQPDIPNWSKLNTAAHLSASFAARQGDRVLGEKDVKTTDGQKIQLSIPHAITMRQTTEHQNLIDLMQNAAKAGLLVVPFTQEMRDGKSQAEDIQLISQKPFDDIRFLGILVFGDKKKVENLTKDFKLAE
ncbi:MAG: hypothetical protein OHK0017_06480 [Patescibacteria group bacterium]